jgi:hypothetical protein
MAGDTVVLITPVYNLTNYNYAVLHFNHICKVSPVDMVRIEYKISNQGWQAIPNTAYKGEARNYNVRGFNAGSYVEWQANDSLAMPDSTWWKEETFDVSFEVGGDNSVQFRFIIQRDNVQGTQISYGWLLDDIGITMATFMLNLPIVELIEPLIKDTIAGSAWVNINARVKTQTIAPIETPWLIYTATNNGVVLGSDTVFMTRVKGDSLWKASIPSFIVGTKVTYSVTGRDATGNYASASSNYIIARPGSEYVEIGNKANATTTYPIATAFNYGWSRQLYYGTEIASGASGGLVTKLAWHLPNANPLTTWKFGNQKCYMRAVDSTFISSKAYVDPLADGATLVWADSVGMERGTFGWLEIELDQSFILPSGKNLLIYWLHQDGQSDVYVNGFSISTTAANTTAYGVSDNSFNQATTDAYSSLENRRADVRLFIERNYTSSSASVSVDMEDQITVSSSSRIPVIATVKNQGLSTLRSIKISYKINDSAVVTKTMAFNPVLDWGLTMTDTLGYYTPKIEGDDTLLVWIEQPNGQTDPTAWDDTVRKIIYGCKDLQVIFVDYPADTLYYQDPVEITARVTSFSYAAAVPVFLYVETKLAGHPTTYDTLPMVSLADNLWTVGIPPKVYNSSVHYAIKLIDILGNEVEAGKDYYVKKIVCTSEESAYIVLQDQSNTTSSGNYPFTYNYGYSRSMSLYTAEEISDKAIGLIDKIALRVSRAGDVPFPMKVWIKTVPSYKTSWETADNAEWDVLTQDATLVYEGNFHFDTTGWVDIPFSVPFLYLDTNNLVLMFEQNCGSSSCYDAVYMIITPQYYYSTTATNKYWYKNASNTPPTVSTTANIRAYRPDLRVDMFPFCPDSNSVALVSINSPQSGVSSGVSVPVNVTIQNKGAYNLSSCTVNWSRNGVLQTPYSYSGNLLKDSLSTFTIGNYTAIGGVFDTIIVWVSMPNGVKDNLSSDDKLEVYAMGCPSGSLSGIKTVSPGGNFSSVTQVLDIIRSCGGLTGNLTLQLKGTFEENVNMTTINPYLNGYHLTITSFDNHPDSAIIKPNVAVDGTAIDLRDVDNVTFKAITVDATATNATYGLRLRDSCNNIRIENCILLATLTTSSNKSPLYSSNLVTDSIFIVNNKVDGGYYGICLSANTTNSVNTGRAVVFLDSNTVTNAYQYGIQSSSIIFKSLSYNTVTNRLSGSSSSWYGLYLSGGGGPLITANRIIQISPVLASPTGIYFGNYNTFTPQYLTLVSNNEIILNMSGEYHGMNVVGSPINLLHNSIFIAGTAGVARGITIANTSYPTIIRNNNIVMRSPAAHPIYFSQNNTSQLYDMDYNNLYAPTNIGYYGSAAITSQALWQQSFPTDLHSVRVLPSFVDSTQDLKLQNYDALICSKDTSVVIDIEKTIRVDGSTTMGCYQGKTPHQLDIVLMEITGNSAVTELNSADSIEVTLQNIGLISVSSMTLKWKLNDQQQPDKIWTGSLTSESKIVIPLGALTYNQTKNYVITVWIDRVNGVSDQDLTNDTASVQGYVCPGLLSGIYQIGSNNADMLSMNEFISVATLCGVNGDITLKLQNGDHDAIDLTNINLLTGNHSLTITSVTGIANDVSIKGVGTVSAITLSQSYNISIKDVTVDATLGNFGIRLTGTCSNIVISGCNILANTTATAIASGAGIYKPSSTGDLDGFTVKNCTINAGHSGVYLYGASASNLKNIIVDSNIFTNQYYYGVYLYYVKQYSLSYNRVSPRSGTTSTTWYGLYLNYNMDGNVVGNRVSANNTAITTLLDGLYINNMKFTKVLNNEIYLNGNANTTHGIFTQDPRYSYIINNTVYTIKSGTAGVNHAFNSRIDQNCGAVIKNNIFVASGGAAGTIYAFYFAQSASTAPAITTEAFDNYKVNYDMDYNVYYSTGTNLGYARQANQVDLPTWKSIMPSDQHSTVSDIRSLFTNPLSGLQLSNYSGFDAPKLEMAPFDIENNLRFGTTTSKGCYHGISYASNASMTEFSDNLTAIASGSTDTVKVMLFNTGSSPINSATIRWTWNNAAQTNVSLTSPLAAGSSVVVSLGKTVSSAAGSYTVKAWIDNMDAYAGDDTVSMDIYICSAPFSGVYTMGNAAGADFTTVSDFLAKAFLCGVNGNVTLEIQSGIYNQSIDLSNTASLFDNYSLTITSVAHNATAVELITDRVGVTLFNSNNIVLKDLTINAINGTYAVQFINGCTNVVIRNCRLLADTVKNLYHYTLNQTPSAAIYKGQMTGIDQTGIVNNISIIDNVLDGGYIGWLFYGGTGYAAGTFATDIIFEGNTLSNQLCHGAYIYYCHIPSFSNNTFLSRTSNTGTLWRACFAAYTGIDVMQNNRVIQRSNAITASVGFYLGYVNRTDMTGGVPIGVMFANNEIILNANGTTTVGGVSTVYTGTGVHGYYSRLNIIHNSIYVSGTGTARGIVVEGSGSDNVTKIRNNNIVMKSSTAYPFYLSTASYIVNHDIDYNNLNAPSYIGYVGANKQTIAEWQAAVSTDKNSVTVSAVFADSSVSLELLDGTGLNCPFYPGTNEDINGYARSNVTTMGAYNAIKAALDLRINRITTTTDTVVIYPQAVPLKIEIENMGVQINIDSATFGWSINGIQQPSYTWKPSTPFLMKAKTEITVGLINPGNISNFDIVVWVENANGRKDSATVNDTARAFIKVFCFGNNLAVQSIGQLVPDGLPCIDDTTSLNAVISNTGTIDYDFSANPLQLYVEVTQPDTFYLDTLISSGRLQSGNSMSVTLTDAFPIFRAGRYDIKMWLDSSSTIIYDDTLLVYYVSGRFGLSIDEDFSNGLPEIFVLEDLNSSYKWEVLSQGTGADTVVKPIFGNGLLSFKGSPGSMATLFTQQLDLSRAVQPSLSFWYFHDTIPCEDYTDVRITIDGRITYEPLLSLTKYNAVYGWKQYDVDLPPFANNQCVRLAFEAMEKSRSGDVAQYIDRIRITARQDIEIKDILISEYTVCDLENKELKVVLSNLTDPLLDFAITPVTVTLEVEETGQVFTETLTTESLEGFASDTITLQTGFNLVKGTYTFKAYFSSVLDVDRDNDTLVTSLILHPEMALQINQVSGGTTNCLAGEADVYQSVVITNTGNMDLFNINLILQIDTGDIPAYTVLEENYTDTILVGSSFTYSFKNAYKAPWKSDYYPRMFAYLSCDSILANTTTAIQECVDAKDLYVLSIDNPLLSSIDKAGNAVQVSATLGNRDDLNSYGNLNITVLVTNSQGMQTDKITETTGIIGMSTTTPYTFTSSYTVPNDTVYHLTVYIESYDIYPQNDTIEIRREVESVGISSTGENNVFTLNQNIPNPATNSTRIDYSVPEAGEVIFHIHSISGQLLYSKTIETERGANSIELNTSTFAAGVYFYSMEYKGQRQVRQLVIND